MSERPYRRFVIVSHLRSGTHLLRTSLESHPSVVCQAEPFNSDDRRLPYPLTAATQEILDGWVYRRDVPSGVAHVGFVLQAYHPHALTAFPGIRANPAWADVWTLLAAMDDLRVVHLRRQDLLGRHLSHLMARQTGVWHAWDPDAVGSVTHLAAPPPPEQMGRPRGARPRLTLDPDRLEADFVEVEDWHARADRALAARPVLQVTYEELCGDYAAATERVLRFLDVPPGPLRPAVAKLEERPPSEAIANYAALVRRFAGTRWAALFP